MTHESGDSPASSPWATPIAELEIIAHRGASRDAPENTLSAVKLAWEYGADAVEIDVMLTRDREIVVMHDARTGRICGDDHAVRDLTLKELRRFDVGRWKGERWAGERIATLAQVLATLPPDRRVFVEIKCGLEIVPILERTLRSAVCLPRQVVVIAFDRDVAAAVKQTLPEVKVLLIAALRKNRRTKRWTPTADELVRIARESNLDGIDVGSCPGIDREFATTILQVGLDLYVWTVNSPRTARRLAELGVQGIATDRPAWMRARLTKSSATRDPDRTSGNPQPTGSHAARPGE